MLNATGLLKTEQEKLTVLSFDEMALIAQYSYSASFERVYFPSKNVQVAMVRGLTAKWKQPVFYDFDCDMTKECLFSIYELFRLCVTKVSRIRLSIALCELLKENLPLLILIFLTGETIFFLFL